MDEGADVEVLDDQDDRDDQDVDDGQIVHWSVEKLAINVECIVLRIDKNY